MSSCPPLTPTPFGKPMLKHWCFAPGWKNLNHGSFGTYPRYVQARLRELQDMAEARPDKFLRWDNPNMLDESRAAVAKLFNVPVEECVFVQNATTGVNTVLRNVVWEKDDAIIFFDTIYGGCEKTILSIQETQAQLSAFRVDYTLPCSHETIVHNFLETVKDVRSKRLNPKLALFDTVVSMPGVRFPFERLTTECRREGILSLIDGAHGIGQIPLDLKKLDADFFVSNCHKWLYTPRGCAAFHVPKRNQHLLRTAYPTSHGYEPLPSKDRKPVRNPLPPSAKAPFVWLFEFVATLDPSPYLSLSSAIDFRRTVCNPSEAVITDYIRDIVQEGADLLAQRLGTSVMDDRDLDPDSEEDDDDDNNNNKNDTGPSGKKKWGRLRNCALATVKLPFTISSSSSSSSSRSAPPSPWPTLTLEEATQATQWMESSLPNGIDGVASHVPIFIYKDQVWCRLSGQVYLARADFEWLAGVLERLCGQVGRGEWRDEKRSAKL